MKPVTDPDLLAQLNGSGPVTDPKVLAEPNGGGSTAAQRAELRAKFDKAASDRSLADDYSGWEGVKANFGAGMDNVVQGAKSLFGMGRDDAAIEEDRKLKKQLGDSTLGGGALQTTGEVVASAPLTMAAGGLASSVAGKFLPKATAWAAGQGSRAFNLGTVGRGAVEGAAGGALAETTSDESRGLNTALGAGIGAAIPAVLGVGAKSAKVFKDKYAPERAAKIFSKQLGPENISQIQDAVDSPNMSSLPLSTAARSENVPLAALERGARSRSGAELDWGFNHDKNVAEAAWAKVKEATANADELPSRIADRELMMAESKRDLAGLNYQPNMKKAAQEISDAAEVLRNTPTARQNPEITNLIGKTESMLKHPKASAGDYASQYWRLSNMLDDTKLPTEQRDIILKLRNSVHQGGDTASGGSDFSDMLGRYMAEQQHVGQSESSKAIREAFQSPEGVSKTKDIFGTPEVTSNTLRKTLAARGENQYGSTIDDVTRTKLKDLEKSLSKHELWQASNSPGSTGLGDNGNLVSTLGSGANNPFNRIWALRGMSNLVLGGSRKATVEAADAALQDPKVWQKMMEDYARSRSPLSPQEYAARFRKQLMMLPGRIGTANLGGE